MQMDEAMPERADLSSKLAAAGNSAGLTLKPMTHRDILVQQKMEVELRLDNINKAIEALDANPNIESVLDLLGRTIGRF